LLERLKIDSTKLADIAASLGQVSEQLIKEKAMGDLATSIINHIDQMVAPALQEETSFGFASTNPDQLIRSVRLFVDGSKSRPLSNASLGSANIIFLALLIQDLEDRVKAQEAVVFD
jgi:putative ATP-dependent endonuclease of OLD family